MCAVAQVDAYKADVADEVNAANGGIAHLLENFRQCAHAAEAECCDFSTVNRDGSKDDIGCVDNAHTCRFL